MTLLERINDVIERVQTVVALLCFIGFVSVTAAEAFSRYVLQHSLLWTNEVARLLFVWSVFLGAAVGFRHQQHLSVDLFSVREDSALDYTQRWFVHGVTLLMCLAWAWFGYEVLTSGTLRRFAILGIPIGYGFAAIPAMGITSSLFLVENLLTTRRLRSELERELEERERGLLAQRDEPTEHKTRSPGRQETKG